MNILVYVGVVVGVCLGLFVGSLYNKWIDDPAVRKAAQEGYVLLAEKTAAEAERDKIQRAANAQAKVLDFYKTAYLDELNKQVVEDEQDAKDRADYANQQKASGTSRTLNDSDVKWLRRRETNATP